MDSSLDTVSDTCPTLGLSLNDPELDAEDPDSPASLSPSSLVELLSWKAEKGIHNRFSKAIGTRRHETDAQPKLANLSSVSLTLKSDHIVPKLVGSHRHKTHPNPTGAGRASGSWQAGTGCDLR